MSGSRIDIEIIFLYVLAVVALAVGKTEHSFLKDRILPVPKSDGKAQTLLVIADAGDAVLARTIGARSGLVVREVIPRIAILTIVFSDGSPLTLAEIRPPKAPWSARILSRGIQTQAFGCLC